MKIFNNRAKLRGIVGIFLIILAFSCIYLWENYGRQQLTYTNVIVFKEDVPENTIVKKEMLGVMKHEKNTLIKDVITDANKIIGKETTTYIPSKLLLTSSFFMTPDLKTGKGKYIFKIPEKWLYSYPETLRRGDQIYLYLVENPDCEELVSLSPESDLTKPLLSAKVAYVKDSTNREVINTGKSRYDGSSTVSQVEIVVTQEIYNKLAEAFKNGYMFNLMYQ